MTCVGVRHWAWKRLLVKSVFLDALRKIMTRTSVQLSLYDPELQQRGILLGHEETKSVFGDLEYKVDCINQNYTEKKVQLIFTVHKKKKHILSECDIYIVRIGPDSFNNPLKYSRPCTNCSNIIIKNNIKNAFYSTNYEYDIIRGCVVC
jgi:hypothetical protein